MELFQSSEKVDSVSAAGSPLAHPPSMDLEKTSETVEEEPVKESTPPGVVGEVWGLLILALPLFLSSASWVTNQF